MRGAIRVPHCRLENRAGRSPGGTAWQKPCVLVQAWSAMSCRRAPQSSERQSSVTAMDKPIEIPQPSDGGSLHALVGRSVSIRNHYDRSQLHCASDIYGDGGVPGAGRYLEGVIVQVTDRNIQSQTVRVGYPAKYFGGMPRYGTVPMRFLRSPNVGAVATANERRGIQDKGE